MANDTFFIDWELWEKMTFVLAMAIVVVFFVGLGKLWWTNRLMRKREKIAREKRARLTEMRKAGISMKRTSDIPFGIRAIQHGIEVDGIWISRPPTPNTDSPRKLASSSTLIAADSAEAIRKGKKLSADSSALSTSPDTRRGRGPSVSDGDHRTNDSHSQQSDQSARSPRVSQFGAPRPTRPQGVNDLSEDTLRRFEGQGLGRYGGENYAPPCSFPARSHRRPSQRSSASSSGESTDSQARSGLTGRSSSGKSYTSSRSSRLHTYRTYYETPRVGYDSVPQMNPEKYSSRYDPPKTPGIENGTGTSGPTGSRTSAPFAPLQTEPISPLVVSHDFSSPAIPSPPEQRFELVDQNFSRPARRSKTGLELFPPGTFGSPTPYDNDVEHIEARTGAEDDVEEGAEVDNQSPHYLKRQGGMFTKSQQTNQQHSYYVSTHF